MKIIRSWLLHHKPNKITLDYNLSSSSKHESLPDVRIRRVLQYPWKTNTKHSVSVKTNRSV